MKGLLQLLRQGLQGEALTAGLADALAVGDGLAAAGVDVAAGVAAASTVDSAVEPVSPSVVSANALTGNTENTMITARTMLKNLLEKDVFFIENLPAFC